jgi:bifunctional N-acetylglucosamine-1-phosphate-uridyltransferase/glucosamine-1-phosphate-acetyltransferase GlmU-like protein
MSWQGVIAALDAPATFRSRVSVYLHPLAGRPILWHVARSLLDVVPPPDEVRILHHADLPGSIGLDAKEVIFEAVAEGDEARALRAAVTPPGLKVLIDGAAPLLAPATIARLLRAGEAGITALHDAHEHAPVIAIAGEGPALASAGDPRHPAGAPRMPPTSARETLRIVDRHTLSDAVVAVRDRLVLGHEARGVNFLLPQTSWLDVDVRIGPDTVIYPCTVLEGATEIGAECVIGPYSRIVESRIGRGAELKGWNYVSRTTVRNHAVLEPYDRRGDD